MIRLRLGILLLVLSWLPISQLLIALARSQGQLASTASANSFRAIVWGIQFIVGLIGIWLAGKLAIDTARASGWKKTPARLWQLFLHGQGNHT